MSWGEKSCIHYGYCSIEATINTCNKTCEKYESKSVELSIEMIASEKDPKCPYCKESIYDVIKQYFSEEGPPHDDVFWIECGYCEQEISIGVDFANDGKDTTVLYAYDSSGKLEMFNYDLFRNTQT